MIMMTNDGGKTRGKGGGGGVAECSRGKAEKGVPYYNDDDDDYDDADDGDDDNDNDDGNDDGDDEWQSPHYHHS